MKYFLDLTDLHVSLIEGIREDNEPVIHFPRGVSRRTKFAALPQIVRAALRILCDRDSHLYVSHPYSSVAAGLLMVSRKFSLFDDGTAYYASVRLPRRKRDALVRVLTRRKFNWKKLTANPDATWNDLLRESHAESFHAIFPDLIDAGSIPVEPINNARAFPVSSTEVDFPGEILFLDTRQDAIANVDVGQVLRLLESEAKSVATGRILFRPHPTQTSQISRALQGVSWANQLGGALEESLKELRVCKLFSFYSSGAISAKLIQQDVQLVCLRDGEGYVAGELLHLFDLLGATEIGVGTVKNEPLGSADGKGTRHS